MKFVLSHKDPVGTLDKAFGLARSGDVILIEDGEHYTQGSWLFDDQGHQMATAGVVIENKGTIRLSGQARKRFLDGNGIHQLRVDRDFWFRFGKGVCLYGGTYDFNESAFADGLSPWYCLGIRFVEGGACNVDDITITGLRGTYRGRGAAISSPDAEAFPLSMEGKPASFTWSRVRVHDCAPESYVSAIFPGGSEKVEPGTRIFVRDCHTDLGGKNWAGYSSNIVSKDASETPVEFIGCESEGCQRGFHNDTGPTQVRLSNCEFSSEYCGVSLSDGTPDMVRNVVLQSCTLNDDCGVIMEGPAANTVVAHNCLFPGSRYGYAEQANSRLVVINPRSPDGVKPLFQTLKDGTMIRNLNDRRLVLA